MKVEFSSRVNTGDDDDGLAIQEQASSPVEKHAGSEPRSPLQKPVAGDYASPSAAPNDADLLVWEETVADESSPSRSVPHDDTVVVQESMTVEISTSSSAVVVRDDDDMFLEGRMAVEFASPAAGPDDDNGVAVEDKMAFESSSPEVVLEDYVMGPEDTIAFEEASPAVILEDYVMGTEDEMAFESASPAVVPNDDDVAVVEDTTAVEFATSEVVPNEDVVVLQDTGAVEHASGALVEDTVKFVSSEVVSNEDVVLLQGTGPIELASGAIVLDEDAMCMQDTHMDELGPPGVIRDAVVVVQEATAVKPPSVAADREDGVMVVENTAAVELVCHDVVPNNNALVLQETGPDELASRAILLDEDAMCMQDTHMDQLGAPGLIRDDVVAKQDTIAVKLPSPAGDQEDGDVVVVEDTAAIELVSHDVVPNDKAVVLPETGGVELASRATVLDEDVMYVQDTNMDELRAPGVIRDDVVVMQDAIAVKTLSPAADRQDGAVVVEDTAAIEFVCHDVVQNDNAVVVQDRVAVKLASPAFVAHDDVMIQQEQDSSQFVNLGNLPLSPPPDGIGLVASPAVAVEDNLVIQALSSSNAVNRHELSLTPAPVDDSNSGQCKEGILSCATDGSSSGEHPASISLPEVSEVPVAGERVSNDSEPSLEALEMESPPESLSAPGDSEYPASISLPEVSEVPVAGERVSNDSEPSLEALEMESPPESLRAPGDCQHPASISLPEVSVVPMAGERLSNPSEAVEVASPRESPSGPEDSKLFSMNGSAGVSTFPAPKEAEPSSEALEMASHQNLSDPEDGKLFSLHGSEGVSTLPTQKEAEYSLEALETASPLESLNAPGDSKLLSMNGLEGASTFPAPEEAAQVENDTFDEQQPAKKAKISGTMYSGTDAVAVVLGQTAEIVLVLAGMSQMRAGRVPTSYERELAASAYQNLGLLVCQLAPNNLVAKESVERMLQDYNEKIVAQKKREDQAWVEALNEAEALANVRAEALARAKAEAAARAQAEMAAKAQAEAAARAQAEAEEQERRQQAAMKVAAPAAANDPSKGGYSAVGGSSLSSGQSAYKGPELTQSPSLPTQAGHHNSQLEIGSQILSPMAKASEIPRSVTQTEKSISVNGRPHAADSKPTLGRPPKVRNRVRKEPATVTIFTPEFFNEVQSQGPDPEKAHVTHKQLCAGVQQFIRDHVPPVSQNLQALPPTYISTPFPCQVCKLIANDTGSVLVCDSCDEVSHVKCVQPPSSRGAAKGDWNCPKCLIASRGSKCPSKYGPIRHGSPNSVKLWPPHDTSEGNPESNRSISNGSVREVSSATAGRQIGLGPLKVQRRTGLEIDTLAHQSVDDPSTGNFGSSPHLIVHLVNEPSPKTSNPLNSSSQSLVQDGNQRSLPSGQSVSSLVQETSTLRVLTKDVAAKDKSELIGQSPTTAPVTVPVTGPVIVPATVPVQIDSLKPAHTDEKSEGGLERSLTQSVAVPEDTFHEVKNRRATPAHIKKTETRTQTTQSKKGNGEPGVIFPGKKADVPLPIVMEWVGESTRRAEGKVYYRACSVGGITFSVSDCALFRPETPDVPPYIARLQVLWEDIATGHKWVRVSWCYYPTDIPLAMGRPGTTLPDEVYESNHCDNNLVGSIQGPCFVLPPLKFMEETDRRRTLKKRGEAVEELPPIFLSRWMYDAPKGVFRPLQE